MLSDLLQHQMEAYRTRTSAFDTAMLPRPLLAAPTAVKASGRLLPVSAEIKQAHEVIKAVLAVSARD